jgi:hypothetical protein
MEPADDGRPLCGHAAGNRLGATRNDIQPRHDGTVAPERKGMSVNANPRRLPVPLRPEWLANGGGVLPLYDIEPAIIPERDLALEPPRPKAHAVVQPARVMPIDEYQKALCVTRDHWAHVKRDDWEKS